MDFHMTLCTNYMGGSGKAVAIFITPTVHMLDDA